MSRNLLLLFVLAYLANISTGVGFRKRSQKSFNGFNVNSWSSHHNERDEDKVEVEPRINEYALIHEARRNRQMSNPHSSLIRTKPFRRSANTFNKKGNDVLFPTYHEIPYGKSFTSHSNPWHMGKVSSARKVPVPEEPEYVY